MNHIIEAQRLDFSYGKKPALKNVNININENQLIGLIGRNSSGKTTLMKLFAGLLSPNVGTISVFGKSPENNLSVLKEVIYSYNATPYKYSLRLGNILENFSMFYNQFDMEFAFKLLDFFSINHRVKYSNLSQGMSSVFCFICAMATRARLTLLDEPVNGMDITIRHKVYDILLRDYIENPRTIIISSHILSEIQDLLSEMLMIDNGEIILYKSMEDIQSMAYRIDGTAKAVTAYTTSRPALYIEHMVTGSSAIIEAPIDESAELDSRLLKLTLSMVTPEELYICKTNHGKEMDFECLWEK